MLTAEQKKQRIGKITSSVAAACLGLDEHMSQVDAWLRVRGENDDDDSNAKACDRGNRLESIALDYAAEETNLVRLPTEFRSIAPWAGDSTDAVYGTPIREIVAVGEAKTVAMGAADSYGQEGTDQIPNHALIQSHWHLIHWPEAKECLVPVIIGGYKFEFRLYRVKRDDEFCRAILDDLKNWHERHIVRSEPPAAGPGDGEWLRKRYPQHAPGTAVASTPEIEQLARDYKAAHEAAEESKLRKDEAGNRLRSLIGDAEMVKAEWGKVTWKNNAPAEWIDWRSLATDLGATEDQVKAHTQQKPGSRVLRISLAKDKG